MYKIPIWKKFDYLNKGENIAPASSGAEDSLVRQFEDLGLLPAVDRIPLACIKKHLDNRETFRYLGTIRTGNPVKVPYIHTRNHCSTRSSPNIRSFCYLRIRIHSFYWKWSVWYRYLLCVILVKYQDRGPTNLYHKKLPKSLLIRYQYRSICVCIIITVQNAPKTRLFFVFKR